jgi:hypothetical protein
VDALDPIVASPQTLHHAHPGVGVGGEGMVGMSGGHFGGKGGETLHLGAEGVGVEGISLGLALSTEVPLGLSLSTDERWRGVAGAVGSLLTSYDLTEWHVSSYLRAAAGADANKGASVAEEMVGAPQVSE